MVVDTPLGKVVVIGVLIPVDRVRTPFVFDMTVGDGDFLVFPFPCSELEQGWKTGMLPDPPATAQDASTARGTTTVSNTDFDEA